MQNFNRNESLQVFLKKCLAERIIPTQFKARCNQSAGIEDPKFVRSWNKILDKMSRRLLKLMLKQTSIHVAKVQHQIDMNMATLQENLDSLTVHKLEDKLKEFANHKLEVYTSAKNDRFGNYKCKM